MTVMSFCRRSNQSPTRELSGSMTEYGTGSGTLATRSPLRTASATASVTSSQTGRSVGVNWLGFSRSQRPATSLQSCSRRRLARVAFTSSRPRWNLCWE